MSRKVKYDEEFKLLAVKRVLNKKEGLRSVCYELDLNKSQLQKWIRYYHYYGLKGLKSRDKNSSYSVSFKLKVLKEIEKRGLSFRSAALEYGIPSSSTIVNWYKKHQEQGKLGLEPLRKGRPRTMTIKSTGKRPKKPLTREEELLLENESLKAHIAVLKKLQALAQAKKKNQ